MAGPGGGPQNSKTVPRQSLWESDSGKSGFSCRSPLNSHKGLFSKDFIFVFVNLQIQLYSILILLSLRTENTAQLRQGLDSFQIFPHYYLQAGFQLLPLQTV